MKLHLLSEYSPEERHKLHAYISTQHSPRELEIIQKVKRHILNGESSLKAPIGTGILTMDMLIDKMKNKRCVSTPTQDVGHSQAKNIIGNAIRDLFPDNPTGNQVGVNEARRAFGLPPVRRPSAKKSHEKWEKRWEKTKKEKKS